MLRHGVRATAREAWRQHLRLGAVAAVMANAPVAKTADEVPGLSKPVVQARLIIVTPIFCIERFSSAVRS